MTPLPTPTGLQCESCGRDYEFQRNLRSCRNCNGAVLVQYDLQAFSPADARKVFPGRLSSVWKFLELLPLSNEQNIVSLGEGGTFLHSSTRLASEIGVRDLLLKNETTNPTGSFVDRGMSVAISISKECRDKGVYCWSKGNFGASMAAYSAKAGIECTIFVHPRVDVGTLYQITAFDPTIRIAESWSQADTEHPKSHLGFRGITPGDPFYLEGIKTTALEICEELNWKSPDAIIVPVGDGSHLAMMWKGLKELERIGILCGPLPRMFGVQGLCSAPISKSTLPPRKTRGEIGMEGLASDIKTVQPLMGESVNRAVKESSGSIVIVSDDEILKAAAQLARTEGIFAEPAGAATIAGLKRILEEGLIEKGRRTICVITGGGLKDPTSVHRFLPTSVQAKKILRRVSSRREISAIGGTKLKILQFLYSEDMYGYAVWKSLRTKHTLAISLPSVYQHLDELERAQLIVRSPERVVAEGRVRHLYKLTSKGRGLLKAESSFLRKL